MSQSKINAVKVVLGTFSLIITKCDWGKFFLKIEKWLPLQLTKKITYSKSSLKPWKDKKYAIELITVKSYKKGLVFSQGKNTKRYHKSFPKARKGVFIVFYHI